MAECLFCDIAGGRLDAEIVYEDEAAVAFLDHRPLFPGHVLVSPRQHCETLPDLPAMRLAPLFAAVQLLARAVERGLDAGGSFVAINNKVSQSVPHLHVHVVPRTRETACAASSGRAGPTTMTNTPRPWPRACGRPSPSCRRKPKGKGEDDPLQLHDRRSGLGVCR